MFQVWTLHDGNVWCFSWEYRSRDEALAQVGRARERGTRAVVVKRR